MPIPYRKTHGSAPAPCAAYIDIVWIPSVHTFYGAVLIIDSNGHPLEFVHNTLEAPTGFLWPEEQVRSTGVAALCHSLFGACSREPDLLICLESLGDATYCRTEIDPIIPFARAADQQDTTPPAWTWINNPPSQSMAAYSLAEALRTRGFATEPFERILRGLRDLYPEAPWSEAIDDPDRQTR